MKTSSPTGGLPTSRTDALSIVVLGLFSAFIGAAPGEDKILAILFTSIANLWAVVSSVLTFREVMHNPHDIEAHLWLFLLGLLLLTIITSSITLLSLLFNESDTLYAIGFLIGFLTIIVVGIFGYVEIILAYAKGCDKAGFGATAFCKHSTGYVVGAVVGATVIGLIGVLFILLAWHRSGSVVDSTYKMFTGTDTTDDEEPHSATGAVINRFSALTKVCLVGVYWFLVDGDLSWDTTVLSTDTKWWVSGQWAKQGMSILNNFLNCLC